MNPVAETPSTATTADPEMATAPIWPIPSTPVTGTTAVPVTATVPTAPVA